MSSAPPGSKAILVVVEAADLRDRATTILARSGYQPTRVERGDEALADRSPATTTP